MNRPRDIVRRLTEKGKGCMLCGLNYPIKYYEGVPHHMNGGDLQACTHEDLIAEIPIEEILKNAPDFQSFPDEVEPSPREEEIGKVFVSGMPASEKPKKSKPKRAKRK